MTTITRPGVRELHNSLSMETMERAYREGMSLSRWLEDQDPTDEIDRVDNPNGYDAFERQLEEIGIVTDNDHERGIMADEFRVFEMKDEARFGGMNREAGRALQIEWMLRQYRKVSLSARALLASDLAGINTALRPYVDAAQVRATQIAPAIPLAELVAITTGIDSDTYRAVYITDQPGESRFVRVGQGAEIPAVKLSQSEKPITLYKYGRRIDMTYEALHRLPLPIVALFIARMAIFAEVDKVSTVVDVLVNGDGNGNAAPVDTQTGLHSGSTAGTLTLQAWLAFKLKFLNPYALTTEIVQAPVALQQLLLNVGTANVLVANSPANTFGGFVPINPQLSDNVRYGISADAPSLTVVAFDRRFAIERVFEIGANISESDRWIKNQVQTLTFTETEGYGKLDQSAVRLLNINA